MLGPALTIASYLVGSVSFGLLAAQRAGVDLRTVGSGNVGATNVGRALGKRVGRQVLALDAAKGAIPAALARAAFGAASPWTGRVGLAAVVGHCFPVWHGFRGGKGAATAAGTLLVVAPPAGLCAAATYFALKKATRRASVGSLGGAAVGALVARGVYGAKDPRARMATLTFVVVTARHARNIGRLIQGTEPES